MGGRLIWESVRTGEERWFLSLLFCILELMEVEHIEGKFTGLSDEEMGTTGFPFMSVRKLSS